MRPSRATRVHESGKAPAKDRRKLALPERAGVTSMSHSPQAHGKTAMATHPHQGAGPLGFRGEIPHPLRMYLEAQPRRVRMIDESMQVVWCNRADDAPDQLRFPGSAVADGTMPEDEATRERWPVARVLRGDPRAVRMYTLPRHAPGQSRPEFRTWRVTAWPIQSPHGMLAIEETESIDAPDEDANRLRQLDQNIEDMLHDVVSRLQQGIDFSTLRLPNPRLADCAEARCRRGEDCPAGEDADRERCWEIARLPAPGDADTDLLGRFEACSRCHVFALASPDPMIRISENFNRLISLLQLKFQEDLDVQHRMQRADKLAIMGELLASIAHEIKNPLGIIIGRLDVLGLELDGMSPQTLSEDLGTIYAQAERVKHIIDHLLRMARPEPPQFQPVQMNAVVTDCLAMVRKNLSERGIHVATELDAELPAISADHIQMQQVLLNLILNARDAMEQGGTLTIASGPDPESPRHVRVSVRDTGEGIGPEQLRRLFSSFHTTKLSKGGTGLGLAVCRRIVRAHNGRIEAESEVGRGTTMHVHLPAVGGRE